jgi:ABC-type antimicrobial peptide transport system permease subunit
MLLPYQLREKIEPENGWHMLSYSTFFLIRPGTNIPALEKKMDDVYHKYAGKEIEETQKSGIMTDTFRWGVRPFLAMHLDTEYRSDSKLGTSDPIYSWILSGIAVFILIIACINFVNLTVAQSLKRAKEIGIRKVIGGQRNQLIRQFLGESYLVCLVAFILALILAELMLPVFNELANKRLAIGYLMDWKLVAGFVGLWLLTGLAAGAYPALVLSGFNPVQTLYNRTKLSGKNWLARVLIVVQFALASFLIVATLCIYSQFDYMTHKDLGYNDKNLLAVTVGKSRDTVMMQLFRNEFARVPGVEAVAPEMQGTWFTGSKANGKEFITKYEHIDGAYLSAIQAPLVAGRNFSPDFPSDSTNSVLVNQAFVREAGWKSNGVGEVVNWLNGKARNLRVVGVVRDFHYQSLKTKIRPQIFSVDSKLPFGKFVVRVNPQQAASAVKAVEKIYRSLVPYHPFVYDYMSDLNFKNYEKEAKWKQIISLSAIITIFISCIGLFGLTMLSAEKRFKEIGIRKVLGASVGSIVRLLSGNFVSLVLLANVIAFPVAWWVLQSWLNNFAYRIPMHWWLFGLAGAIALVIALVTVSLQALRAATANPVKSLRSE